jgi:DNA-directed RNA polymerase specialized sigma24 family protein
VISGSSGVLGILECRCPLGTIRSRVARAREDLLSADEQRRNDAG